MLKHAFVPIGLAAVIVFAILTPSFLPKVSSSPIIAAAPALAGLAESAVISTTVHLPLLSNKAQASPAQRLVWLPLSETAGASLFEDRSGNQQDGRCVSPACPHSALYGKSGVFALFDGIDDQIEVAHAAAFDPLGQGDFSIEAWVYLTGPACGFCRLINKFDGNRGFSLDLADNAGHTTLTLYLSDGHSPALARSTHNLLLNEWHHVVAVVSRELSTVSLYVDGVETPYAQRDSLSGLGSLSNSAPLHIGKLAGETNGFAGFAHDIAVYQGSLAGADVQSHFQATNPQTAAWFARWNSQQVLTVLQGFGLEAEQPAALTEQDYGEIPVRAVEALRFSLPTACAGCTATVFTFANHEDLEAVRAYFGSTVQKGVVAQHLYGNHNALIVLDNNVPGDKAAQYGEALALGLTQIQLEAPTNQTETDFASWDRYYPTDRGQQRDAQTGRSQRTYDRWEGDNRWLYGQATWLYQDPDGGDAAPLGLPSSYQGQTLDYYYHFHCEKEENPDIYKDCLNWQIYIELFGMGEDKAELAVWARGGWGRLSPTTPTWEAYYRPDSFNGNCTTQSVLENATDALLIDPAAKIPWVFRMPNDVGAWYVSDPVCTLIFDSYLYRREDVQKAARWHVITYLRDKTYDAKLDRTQIKAENVYYEYLATVNGEAVFKQWAREVYWVWEMKPEQPLSYGMDSFWWGAWPMPPEDNRDSNLDPKWAERQWCHMDRTQGPEGLGLLLCEP